MSLKLGSTTIGSLYLGSTKIGEAYFGNVKVYGPSQPVPPVLPANTIRCKFSTGYTPTIGDSQTLADASANIWDIYKSGTDWRRLFNNITQLEKVIAANATGVTNMSYMFLKCTSLTSVPLFDTSSASNMDAMFSGCTNLASVPLFDTSSATTMYATFHSCSNLTSVPLFDTSLVTNMAYMFYNCTAVESGALALYQQASTQATPPTSHDSTFANCGSNTVTGAAELAQIGIGWK